jgi:ATP-dependent Clp protease ATP-binding subunit ClpA
MGVNIETVREWVEKQIGQGPQGTVPTTIPYTPRVKHVLSLAAKEAMQLKHTYVGTEHILLGLLRENEGVAGRVLRSLNVDLEETRKEILRELEAGHPFSLPSEGPKVAAQAEAAEMAKPEIDFSAPTPVDLRKRYDLYCTEAGQQIIYRNVLFKGPRMLFPSEEQENTPDFIEIEEADGQRFFVAKSAIVKFCEHRAPSGPPPQAD